MTMSDASADRGDVTNENEDEDDLAAARGVGLAVLLSCWIFMIIWSVRGLIQAIARVF